MGKPKSRMFHVELQLVAFGVVLPFYSFKKSLP